MQSTRLYHVWTQLLAGWADHLDPTGANLIIDGVRNRAEPFGSYEGSTRMMWALGGWLSQAHRTSTVEFRDRSYDAERLMTRALLAGTDPDDAGYWGDPASTGLAQATVESAQVAYALWQSRSRIWNRLSDAERDQIAQWLIACGQPPQQRWRNNWALFWALNHTVRKALGLPFDPELIHDVMGRYLDQVYCGNGWYDDGPERGTNHFDDYNLWVFASHVLAWIDVDGGSDSIRSAELLERVRLLMAHMPSFFAANGAWPEYGRSGAYKFARLGAMIWAYRQGAWPHRPGLLRAIVERHIMWYVRHGAIRADGTLRQSLTSTGSPSIRETYISTGAPYWAMQAFGALWALADDDPFWTAEPEPLPIEQEDIHQVFPEPGWIVTGTAASGNIHRFPLHTSYYPEKYAKFVYSTAAPYNAGLVHGSPAPDAMIALTDGLRFSHRTTNESAEIHPDGLLRYRHRHSLDGITALFETVIIPDGDLHLRIHRLVSSSVEGPVDIVEGAGALGFDDGEHPELVIDRELGISGGASLQSVVAMRCWDTREAALPRSFGNGNENIVFGNNIIPHVGGTMAEGDVAISTVFLGTPAQRTETSLASLLGDRPDITWSGDHVTVSWRGKRFAIL